MKIPIYYHSDFYNNQMKIDLQFQALHSDYLVSKDLLD